MSSEQRELMIKRAVEPVEPGGSWGLLLVPIVLCLAMMIYAGLVS
ncbi:MAG TPA: hypothetical protein VEQ66_14705 [Propionibacteriaceae bacterium]|nr:hypothetical protein [Propionibacteriaceae bacterium]